MERKLNDIKLGTKIIEVEKELIVSVSPFEVKLNKKCTIYVLQLARFETATCKYIFCYLANTWAFRKYLSKSLGKINILIFKVHFLTILPSKHLYLGVAFVL